jgi:hypothetical protein
MVEVVLTWLNDPTLDSGENDEKSRFQVPCLPRFRTLFYPLLFFLPYPYCTICEVSYFKVTSYFLHNLYLDVVICVISHI